MLASSTSVVDAILVWFSALKCNRTKMIGIMIRTAWTTVICSNINIASKIQIAEMQRSRCVYFPGKDWSNAILSS